MAASMKAEIAPVSRHEPALDLGEVSGITLEHEGAKIEIVPNGHGTFILRVPSDDPLVDGTLILHPASSRQVNIRTRWPGQ